MYEETSVVNPVADVLEAAEAAVIMASQPTPHGPHHKLVHANYTKRELLEEGVETILNDWRYQVEFFCAIPLSRCQWWDSNPCS